MTCLSIVMVLHYLYKAAVNALFSLVVLLITYRVVKSHFILLFEQIKKERKNKKTLVGPESGGSVQGAEIGLFGVELSGRDRLLVAVTSHLSTYTPQSLSICSCFLLTSPTVTPAPLTLLAGLAKVVFLGFRF